MVLVFIDYETKRQSENWHSMLPKIKPMKQNKSTTVVKIGYSTIEEVDKFTELLR